MVDQDGRVDGPVEHRGVQAGEHGAAVHQDQVELAAEPGHGARPARGAQEFAGASDGGAEGKDPEVVVGSLDQGIGQGVPLLDDVVEPDVEPQSQESR